MAAEPDANAVANLNNAMINANSGDNKNETAVLMMTPSMNWAEFLTHAPLYIHRSSGTTNAGGRRKGLLIERPKA